jgi:hypothetical protein
LNFPVRPIGPVQQALRARRTETGSRNNTHSSNSVQ